MKIKIKLCILSQTFLELKGGNLLGKRETDMHVYTIYLCVLGRLFVSDADEMSVEVVHISTTLATAIATPGVATSFTMKSPV